MRGNIDVEVIHTNMMAVVHIEYVRLRDATVMADQWALLRPHNLAAKVGIEKYQNGGDFWTDDDSWKVSLGPHNTQKNIALNFLHSIRDDLNLPRNMEPEFLRKCAEKADPLFTCGQTWWQCFDDRL